MEIRSLNLIISRTKRITPSWLVALVFPLSIAILKHEEILQTVCFLPLVVSLFPTDNLTKKKVINNALCVHV